MKFRHRAIAFAVAFLGMAAIAQPDPLSTVIGQANAAKLLSGEKVVASTFGEKAARRNLPVSGSLLAPFDTRLASLKPSITVEACYLVPRSHAAQTDALLDAYSAFMSVSSLEGITYWSASRKARHVLYEKSSIVDAKGRREPRPDPVRSSVPPSDSFIVRQTDTTFGENWYQWDFSSTQGAFSLSVTNLSDLNYGILRLMDAQALAGFFFVVPCDEGILLYTVTGARAFLLPGLDGKVEESFVNRADAMNAWLKARL